MSGFKQFLLFAGICLLVTVVLAALIYWQRENISSWWTDTTNGVVRLFGWGLILIVLTVLTLAVVILSKASLLWRYWNKWLGGLILVLAVWGILGLIAGYGRLEGYSLGGRIGQEIVGTSTAVGILLVILIVIVGLFIISPKGFANLIAGLFGKIFSRRRAQTLDGLADAAAASSIRPVH